MADEPNPHALWEHNFIQQMKLLREARKMTQTDLARELKAFGLPFHQPTVQRIENGERPVRLNEAHLIARVLGVDVQSMAANSTPNAEREIRYAVDQLRITSSTQANALREDHFREWLEDVEVLVLVLGLRVPADAESLEDLDPVAAWGMVWAMKALYAFEQLLSLWQGLDRIGGRFDYVDTEGPTPWPVPEITDTLFHWRELFQDDAIAKAIYDTSREVYSTYPVGREQETEG
ncbi:helix-turn-helix transcriptional regulator [Nonomuraea sp. K274]|uniref:Helix-turn-helix transcriptional regulator n=1 Tax=Nonomuraea cypriaca TaxID=1187855 RepID=A0A931AC60_9ACTN|nr:helix-turn-helix transcriptional regulator [Nonomuraea cypriaca]MBF8187315.1 helix-turn-helix transcriptional regulator [Nonomuraea cypriaca]